MNAKYAKFVEKFIQLENDRGSTALANNLRELDLKDSNLVENFWKVIDDYINDFID